MQLDPGKRLKRCFTLSMVFENAGTVPISGTAFINVQDEAGVTVKKYEGAFEDLAAGESKRFKKSWDTSAEGPGTYIIASYVTYGGQVAGPASVTVRTRPRCHQPLVLKRKP